MIVEINGLINIFYGISVKISNLKPQISNKNSTFAPKYIIIYKKFDVTAPEYKQLKAFARVDGALLSLLMIASFACYIAGFSSPLYGSLSMIAMAMMPFFAGIRLKHFRDTGLEGSISFLRGWAYVCLMFFYSGLLFALAQYAYFAYMDQGYMMQMFNERLSTPEIVEMIQQAGMTDYVNEAMHAMQEIRPIDFALNTLTMAIMAGLVLGLPIAAVVRKVKK